MRQGLGVLLVVMLAAGVPRPAGAQSAWEKLKQSLAKPRPGQAAQTAQPQPAARSAAGTGFHPTGPSGTPEKTAALAATAGFLDISGVKLGMSGKAAIAALKAHNSLLQVTTDSYVHQLIPGQTLVAGIHAKIPLVQEQIFEEFEVALSTLPNDSFVTAVSRSTHYPPGKQPTFSSALEGMRARYGRENYTPRASPSGPGYYWVLDLKGNPISGAGPEAERVVSKCSSPFLAVEWQRASDAVGLGYDEAKYASGLVRCSDYALVEVRLSGSLLPGQSEYLLDNLSVVVSNGALYRSATEATHAQYLAAQTKLDADRMNKAQKQGVDF